MFAANRLTRDSLPDQIKAHLLERIMNGTLQPGDRLVELRIAAEMETSQAPVREAIRELEAMGVVETRRNKGARVRVISIEELRDFYDVRCQLEGYAAELAALRRAPLKTRLTGFVKEMRAAARRNDSIAFAEANSGFHRTIVEAAGNGVLTELWETLNVMFRTVVNVLRQQQDLSEVADSHLEIVDAVASGDPRAARRAAEAHVVANRPR